MEVAISPIGIALGRMDDLPEARTATVSFQVVSDIGTIEFHIAVVPDEDEPPPKGLDDALRSARRTLAEFGKTLAREAEVEQTLVLYHPSIDVD